VAPYGGARKLLEAFLSTMDVWPASVQSGSSPEEATHSERYGYTVILPAALEFKPATLDWAPNATLTTTSSAIDTFTVPTDGAVSPERFLGIAAQPVQTGLSADAWMTAYAEQNQAAFGDTCGGTPDSWQPVEVLGYAGRRAGLSCEGADVAEVVFVRDGTGWLIGGDPDLVDMAVARLAFDR
jgi:hypothetical protein